MQQVESVIDDITIIIDDWQDQIKSLYKVNSILFHDKIWEMSQTAFDMPREIQVLIDSKDDLYISVGTPGFVSFEGQESQLPGMRIPLKQWIHTHPFGSAYFSGTDMKTIAIWHRMLMSATVLGNDERMTIYFRAGLKGEDFQEFVQYTWIGDEEE